MVKTRKPTRAVPQSFGVMIEDLAGSHVLISASSDDEQLAVRARALKRCDRPYRVEGGDWLTSKTAKRAASIPFTAGQRKRLKPSEARKRTLLAVKAARDAMHLAFGRKQAFEEALIQIIIARNELRSLKGDKSDRIVVCSTAHKALICTKSLLRTIYGVVDEGMPEKGMHRVPLSRHLSQSNLERNAALLECVMRDGSCLSEWLERVEKLTGRGRGSTYEIDTFVRSLLLFWEHATGKLPTKNVPETLSTDGRFCDFYNFLSAASEDVGMKQKADRRVREVLKQLNAERKAARHDRAQQNAMERAALNSEQRAERRRRKKADCEASRRRKKRVDKTLDALPVSSSND